MGLETSKRGLTTAQQALYTTGHNVANANTPGYSRQRLNLNPTLGFPSPGLNSPKVPGQLGTGVEAGSVQRIRDSFLDKQYRSQNSDLGYYSSQSESFTKMEDIMNDPTESGLLTTMNSFWTSLEDLTTNSNSTSARSVVASSGEMVADTLNYYYTSLTNVQKDQQFQIGVKKQEINTIISNINELNKNISEIEPNGYIPNDMYDQRDLLVDQLSKLVNVKVESVIPTDYGIADRAVAEGLYKIDLVLGDGTSVNLINVDSTGIKGTSPLDIVTDEGTGAVQYIKVGDQTVTNYNFSGELSALIDSAGYLKVDANGNPVDENGNPLAAGAPKLITGLYPDMLHKLNNLTEAFVKEFNYIHKQGYALGADNPSGLDFFETDNDPLTNAAGEIRVNSKILADSSLIAAAGQPGGAAGDNENAHKLAQIKSKSFTEYGYYKQKTDPATSTKPDLPDGLSGSFDDYYSGMIGKLGVDSASTQKNKGNTQTLLDSIDKNRQSVSAVSLDEEMTDMVKYQQAYNASARMITVINECLDKLINNM